MIPHRGSEPVLLLLLLLPLLPLFPEGCLIRAVGLLLLVLVLFLLSSSRRALQPSKFSSCHTNPRSAPLQRGLRALPHLP